MNDNSPVDPGTESPADTVSSPPEKTSPQPASSLARKIARRTTDLIAISLILVAGLSIGKTLVHWWSIDEEEIPTPQEYASLLAGTETSWGMDGRPVELRFGESPLILRRQQISGSYVQALERLTIEAKRIVTRDCVPPEDFAESEQRLIRSLESQKPILQESGRWRIDHLQGPVSLIVGTHRFPLENPSASPPDESEQNSLRLVCWGLAFPSGKETWTLYTFLFTNQNPDHMQQWPEVELPSQAERILSMESAGGSLMMSFKSRGTTDEWMGFFRSEFRQQQWELQGEWTIAGDYIQGRFEFSGENAPGWVEVQLVKVDQNSVRGLVNRFPVTTEQPQKK